MDEIKTIVLDTLKKDWNNFRGAPFRLMVSGLCAMFGAAFMMFIEFQLAHVQDSFFKWETESLVILDTILLFIGAFMISASVATFFFKSVKEDWFPSKPS
jgi:uncharacterized membrane-anchored protein